MNIKNLLIFLIGFCVFGCNEKVSEEKLKPVNLKSECFFQNMNETDYRVMCNTDMNLCVVCGSYQFSVSEWGLGCVSFNPNNCVSK